jgi:hypothetical protein
MESTTVIALSTVRRGASDCAAASAAAGRPVTPTVVTEAAVSATSTSPQLIQAKTDIEIATKLEARPPMPLKKPTSSGMPSILTVSAR